MEVFRSGASPRTSASKAVTALVGLERWRGFCGGGQTLNIEAAAVAAVQVRLRALASVARRRLEMTSHSSCVGMICDRSRGFENYGWTAAGAALLPEVGLPVRARFAARARVLVVIVQKLQYAVVLPRVTHRSSLDLSRRL